MALELQRPTRVRIRFGGGRTGRSRGSRVWVPVAIEGVVRLLLVGFAIGIFLRTGPDVASVAFVGVIALGAALSSWDR